MLGLGLSITSLPVIGAGPIHLPQTLALFARMATPPTAARAKAINNLVSALVVNGIWDRLDAFYVLAAADSQAARLNWIADQYNLTEVNSPTFAADQGYTGNGTTSYLETGFNPTTAASPKFVQNDASMFIWSRTDLANGALISADIGNANSRIIRSNLASGQAGGRANMASTNNAIAVGAYPGLAAWSRTASAVYEGYANGVDAGGGTTASAALSNANFHILEATSTASGVNQIAVAGWGASLTPAQHAALYEALAS